MRIYRIVEIEDDLQERVVNMESEILDNFKDYFKDNTNMSDFDQYYQAQGCDAVHNTADLNTPIYYSNIDGLYYLYGDKFDEAYNNAGIEEGNEDNHRQVTIYCYLAEKGFDYLRALENAFEEWLFNAEIDEGAGKMPWDYL